MLKAVFFACIAVLLSGCTPSVGVGVPVGKYGYAGVNVSENGISPSAGIGIGL